MSNKYIAFIIALLFSGALISQQLPQYTQTSLNYLAINPAMAGSKECFDIKLGYRGQWLGIDGNPTTAFVSAHSRIGGDAKAFHGIGAIVENDNFGPFAYTSITAAYAYNFRVNKRYRMAFGLAAGTLQYRLDASSLELPDVGPSFDDAILGNQAEFLFPIIHFGWWLYRNDRFYGIAVRHLTENEVTSFGNDTKLRRHYVFSAGRTIDIDDDLYFKPTVNVRYVAGSRISADLNAMLDYKDRVAAGFGFRSEHGISGIIKINAFKYVTVGYAYDLTLNRLRYGSRNTHEIILGVQACPRGATKAVPCSAYD